MIDDITEQMSNKLADAQNEVLKQLVSITGVNTDIVNEHNAIEFKREIEARGYEITSHGEGNRTFYNLLYKGNVMMTGEVWYEIKNEDGNANIIINRKLTPRNGN